MQLTADYRLLWCKIHIQLTVLPLTLELVFFQLQLILNWAKLNLSIGSFSAQMNTHALEAIDYSVSSKTLDVICD